MGKDKQHVPKYIRFGYKSELELYEAKRARKKSTRYSDSPYKEALSKMLQDFDVKVFVEVGVCKSKLLKYLLSNLNYVREYWAVDPWDYAIDSWNWGEHNEKNQDAHYNYCCKLMLKFPALKVLRMTSVEASQLFKRQSLDMVFIDADHSYDTVREDIMAWLPKVKKGGILCGHDFGANKHKGVAKAVRDTWAEDEFELWNHNIWVKRL